MTTEIVLGMAGKKVLKGCGENNIAFGQVVEEYLSRLTLGEFVEILKTLKLEE
ncbi:MAG: hypothetical protein KAR20_26405 [Candidatus Heimdallarchaeota archaeon]|nr:hypothetical protein [Candidatus Heimdallarchaeota archaeon]